MRIDMYTRIVVTIATVLLAVIAAKQLIPQNIAQTAGTTSYVYTWYRGPGGAAFSTNQDDRLDEAVKTLNKMAGQGWEVVAAVPIQGSIEISGTPGETISIVYILRKPK